MQTRLRIYKLILAVIALGLVAWIAVTAYRGNYLEAVAISGVSSILLWFALGAGKSQADD